MKIVGLTASPGVGKGGKLETALEHLRQLCISLDVQMICTVKTHKEELERYVSEPSHGESQLLGMMGHCMSIFSFK